MRIGDILIDGWLVLAPMAGKTDIAFRHLCKELGASLVFCEFASAEGILRNEEYALRVMRTEESERPVGVQIFGEGAKRMGEACRKINELKEHGRICPDILDINFGCPGKNVMRCGAGAALLKNKEEIKRILNACIENSKIPISAKIRIDGGVERTIEIAKEIEDCGAFALTVHARTIAGGKKRNSVQWEVIKRVKESVNIQVIGNGGVISWKDAIRMRNLTGCDAVMVARGALYDPFIFLKASSVKITSKEIENPERVKYERMSALKRYVELSQKFGILNLQSVRSHALDFCFGLERAREMREKISKAGDIDDIVRVFGEI
ncbi:MAG: tRNA-dihydrouridine synthase family protein [Candidatus Anstonellales archaeon]